jgi:hypothetical protein
LGARHGRSATAVAISAAGESNPGLPTLM